MADETPQACMPCRGTGSAISKLGGEPQNVPCPWCRGGGVRLSEVDAQAAWLQEQTAGDGDEGSSADTAA